MGFYQNIRDTYGYSTMKELKLVANTNIKLATLRNRKTFLLQCRRHGLIPTHITTGVKNVTNLTGEAVGRTLHQTLQFNSRLRTKLLNLEIKVTHDSVRCLEKTLRTTKNKLSNKLPYYIIVNFFRNQSIKYNRTFFQVKNANLRKFNNLKRLSQSRIITPAHWIKNLTEIDIPNEVSNFLALGPKFSIEPVLNDINIPKLLSDVDHIVKNINDISSREKNLLLTQSTNIITNFVHKENSPNPFYNNFVTCKNFLKSHPELKIIQSDKMKVTTIVTNEQYDRLSRDILADVDYYQVLERDPSNTIQQKANQLITQLEKNRMIEAREGSKHRCYNGVINKFYGLPKIHKPVLTLRPIISGVNSPNRGIAQLITNILTVAYNPNNNFFIKDSFQFCTFIHEFQLPDGYVIVSLDVKSLFNNITIDLAKNSIEKHWDDIQSHCNISKRKFFELIEFLFDTTVFSYNNTVYKQILGMPMGSPVSPILAQYVMDDLINDCLSKIEFEIPFLKKYVDDIILSIPSNSTEQLLVVFNSYNQRLKFTIEEEDQNRSVPFLDTKLIRRMDNTVITSWYTKPGSSGRYLHYESFHSEKQKINVLLGMKNRVITTSHTSLRLNNLKKLAELFITCGYPPPLVKKLLFNRSSIHDTSHSDTGATENGPPIGNNQDGVTNIFYYSIPNIAQVSHRLKKLFLNFTNIRLALKNKVTINSLFTKLKDQDNFMNFSNVVYCIPCEDCEKKYIGQTSRKVKDRITSHRSDVRHNKQSCMLAKHALTQNHNLNYNEVRILDYESNSQKRMFLEMCHIFNEPEAMNARTDIEGLSVIYTYLLHSHANRRIRNNTLYSTV